MPDLGNLGNWEEYAPAGFDLFSNDSNLLESNTNNSKPSEKECIRVMSCSPPQVTHEQVTHEPLSPLSFFRNESQEFMPLPRMPITPTANLPCEVAYRPFAEMPKSLFGEGPSREKLVHLTGAKLLEMANVGHQTQPGVQLHFEPTTTTKHLAPPPEMFDQERRTSSRIAAKIKQMGGKRKSYRHAQTADEEEGESEEEEAYYRDVLEDGGSSDSGGEEDEESSDGVVSRKKKKTKCTKKATSIAAENGASWIPAAVAVQDAAATVQQELVGLAAEIKKRKLKFGNGGGGKGQGKGKGSGRYPRENSFNQVLQMALTGNVYEHPGEIPVHISDHVWSKLAEEHSGLKAKAAEAALKGKPYVPVPPLPERRFRSNYVAW